MAASTKGIQVTQQTKPQPPTAAPHEAPAQTTAPTQATVVTGQGPRAKTAPTFAGSPALKPNPPSNQVKIVQPDRQPGKRGPQAPLGGQGYVN